MFDLFRIGAPQSNDLVSATAEDSLKAIDLVSLPSGNLLCISHFISSIHIHFLILCFEQISPETAAFFSEHARKLLDSNDPISCVAAALAAISGYSGTATHRSLLCGSAGLTTILATANSKVCSLPSRCEVGQICLPRKIRRCDPLLSLCVGVVCGRMCLCLSLWSTDTQTDAPTDTSTDTPTDASTDALTDTSTDSPTDTPTDTPTARHADRHADMHVDSYADKTRRPTRQQTRRQTDTSTGMPTDSSTGTPTDTSTDTLIHRRQIRRQNRRQTRRQTRPQTR